MTTFDMPFSWNHARTFLHAAESGSLSAAARAMGISQPTASRQIAALEEALGVTLFERLSQGLELTAAGSHLFDYVQAMGLSAQQLVLAAEGASQQMEGRVSVSVSEIDALFRMPALVERIRTCLPGIQLDVVVSNAASDIKRREADIALRSFRPSEPDLITRKLFDQSIWLYGTPDHLKQYGRPTHPAEVSGVQIIGFEHSNVLIDHLSPLGWQLTERNFPIVTAFQGLQWELAKRGLGLGFFPEAIGDAEPALVRAFEHFGPPLTLPLWLVTHRELRTNLRVRQVFDLLAQELLRGLLGDLNANGIL